MKVILIIVLIPAYFLLGYVTAYALSFIDNDFIDDDLIFMVVTLWPLALAIFILWVMAVIIPKWIIERLTK